MVKLVSSRVKRGEPRPTPDTSGFRPALAGLNTGTVPQCETELQTKNGRRHVKRGKQRERPYHKNHMTRCGKIARLPKEIREELNQRLDLEDETETALAEWLNGLPEVQEVLKEFFGGQPIRQQNVSEWRLGGFVEWQMHRELQFDMEAWREDSKKTGKDGVSDSFTSILATRMSNLAWRLLSAETDPHKQWELMCAASKQFSRMRKDDHRLVRTQLRQERWKQDLKEARLDREENNPKPMTREREFERAQRRYQIFHPHETEMFNLFQGEVKAFEAKYELMMAERGTPLPAEFQARWKILEEQRMAKRKEQEQAAGAGDQKANVENMEDRILNALPD